MRVLFVCMGNICRSPLAAAALRVHASAAGLQVEIESAGTHDYHVGEGADPRAIAAGRRRGYDLSDHRARQVAEDDFERCDYVLAMDRANLVRLRRLAPVAYVERLALLLAFAPDAGVEEVPDPYYGGAQAFERALDLMDAAMTGFIAHLRESRSR
ncbi:MAG: low molecular weight protein-tyrosine-phosphatase [Gammaproteobacteria bacterium]